MRTIRDADTGSPAQDALPGESSAPQTREALARRKDELELVLAAGRIGFCILDGGGHVTAANSLFRAGFGWPPDARIEWSDVLHRTHAEDRDALACAVRAVLADGGELDLAVRALRPADGAAADRWIEMRGRTVRSDDGASYSLVLIAREGAAR